MRELRYRILCHVVALATMFLAGCMEPLVYGEESFSEQGRGLFIVNEGNFTYANASLSYYSIDGAGDALNEIFYAANGVPLGDTAQSMSIRGEYGYVVVNYSGAIYMIHLDTFRLAGEITNLTSPRYIHFVDDHKAYVSDLYAEQITIFDPLTMEVTGHIPTTGHRSTERMVQCADRLFVCCWSYDNTLLVIDTKSDMVIDSVEVGWQPTSVVKDCNDKLWVLCEGKQSSGSGGGESAQLLKIDPTTLDIELRLRFAPNHTPSELMLDGKGENLYFIEEDIWRMSCGDEYLPAEPIIRCGDTIFYGLGIDPVTGEIYVADAIDYMQDGIVSRYTPQGELVESFYVGITPGAFCFKP